jgi:hypothetical protein
MRVLERNIILDETTEELLIFLSFLQNFIDDRHCCGLTAIDDMWTLMV